MWRSAGREISHQVRKSREELIEIRVGVRGLVRESKKRFASWGDGGSEVKWGESELGFERLQLNPVVLGVNSSIWRDR